MKSHYTDTPKNIQLNIKETIKIWQDKSGTLATHWTQIKAVRNKTSGKKTQTC